MRWIDWVGFCVVVVFVAAVGLVACGDDDDMDDQQGNWGRITDPVTGRSFRCYSDVYLSWCYGIDG